MEHQAQVPARIRFVKDSWREEPNGVVRIGSKEDRRGNTAFRDVQVTNARPLMERGELDLDTNGFVLAKHAPLIRDASEKEEIEKAYYPATAELLKSLSGAPIMVPLDWLIRSEAIGSDWSFAYARYMHLDSNRKIAEEWLEETARMGSLSEVLEYTGKSMARYGVSCDYTHRFQHEGPLAPPYHFAIYQTWQPIAQEVQRNPLTLIDARTLNRNDFVDYVLKNDLAPDYGGSLGALPFYSPEQHLYYFPFMQTDEVLVFKQMDSRSDCARQCPHTSFDDPLSPAEPLGRRSLEVTWVAIFGS